MLLLAKISEKALSAKKYFELDDYRLEFKLLLRSLEVFSRLIDFPVS